MALKGYLKDRYVIIALVAAVVAWALMFSFAYVEVLPSGEVVVLHRNVKGEIDVRGGAGDVIAVTIAFGFLAVLDHSVALMLFRRERMLAYVIAYATVLVEAVGAIALYLLTVLN